MNQGTIVRSARMLTVHLLAGAVLVCGMTSVAYASSGFESPLKNITSLEDLLVAVLNSLIYILSPIIVVMIVMTGFKYVAAQGNPTKIAEAHRALMWTVVGALAVLGSKALAYAIEATVSQFKTS